MSRGKTIFNKTRTARNNLPRPVDNDNINTRFSYLYRDASNGKIFTEVILKGKFKPSELKIIRQSLDQSQYFIPYQVGLPMPQEKLEHLDEFVDHPWVELNLEDIEQTTDNPTIELTCRQLALAFEGACWDEIEASAKLEELVNN